MSKSSMSKFLTDLVAFIAVLSLIWFILYSIQKIVVKEPFIEKYIEDEPKIQELYTLIKPLFEDRNRKFEGKLSPLNKMDFLNHISMKKGNKSYTINKEVVHMCLKDENGKYYDNNSLLYVLLHEFSHSINPTIGHDKSFHDTFDELLQYATDMGVYDPSKPMVANYCEHGKEE